MEVKNSTKQAIQMDDVDQRLMAALRADGRAPFAQVAEELGVSPGMIRQRYNRLVEAGVLKVVAVTNPLRLGNNAMAMIGIRADGRRLLKVAARVAALEEVVYLIVVTGRFDMLAEVVCRDQADLLRFLTEKLHAVDGVREAETFMHLRIEKEVYF